MVRHSYTISNVPTTLYGNIIYCACALHHSWRHLTSTTRGYVTSMAVCTVYSFVRITGKTWTEFSRGLKRSAPKLRFEVGFTHAWSKESCKRQQISRYRTIIIITATYSLTAAKLQTCEWPNLPSRRCRIRLADYRIRTTATAASTLCADILSVQTIKWLVTWI